MFYSLPTKTFCLILESLYIFGLTYQDLFFEFTCSDFAIFYRQNLKKTHKSF